MVIYFNVDKINVAYIGKTNLTRNCTDFALKLKISTKACLHKECIR